MTFQYDHSLLIGDGTVPLGRRQHLYYQLHGAPSAAALLLLRPLGGNLETWGAFREQLARHFLVVSFDQRGSGRSSRAPIGQRTQDMADDAAALLTQLGIERAHVVGISLGGMVATWLALRRPQRVRRLVLGSTPARGRVLIRHGGGQTLQLMRCMLRGAEELELCLWRQVLSEPFLDSARAQGLEAEARKAAGSMAELVKQALAGALHDVRTELTHLHAPTLVLAGELDKLVPPAVQRALAQALPNARFELVPSAAHAITLEQPESTAARVVRFLRPADGD